VFRVKGSTVPIGVTSKAYLNFTFNGTNYESYKIESYCVLVKLVSIANIPPKITFYNIINSTLPG